MSINILLEFFNIVNMTLCSIFMVIIIVYIVENKTLRTKKNLSLILTFLSLTCFYLGNYLYFSFESHLLFAYPFVEGFFDFIISSSLFFCLIYYIAFLFLESGKEIYTYTLVFLLIIFISLGTVVTGLILITTGVEEMFFYNLLALGGTCLGSILGMITLSETARKELFPVQDRLLMRRGHLKYVGEGIIFISCATFFQLFAFDIPEMLIIAIALSFTSVLLFFIAIAKTREHLREVSMSIIENQLDDLKTVDKLKTQIIDISSHEIRTPIAVIKGFFDLLVKDENDHKMSPEERNKCLMSINRNIERIERSLSNIYDFSEIRRDLFDFHFELGNLIEVIEDTVNDMKSMILQKGLTFSTEYQLNKENIEVRMDAVRISQVIRNLLENAIKYSSGGEINIQVTETKEEYIIRVADQGSGIEEKRMKTLFDPFKDRDKSEISVKGLGLGLYISKNIIEGHNGRIWVESDTKGSRFYFSLPKEIYN